MRVIGYFPYFCFVLLYTACMFACNVQETVYQLMDDLELSLQKTDDLLFEVKACGAVQLLLMQNNTNFQTQMYEITIIGGSNLSEVTISKERSDTTFTNAEHELQRCDVLRTFWITWDSTTIQVGRGAVAGEDEAAVYYDSNPVEIKHIAVSPANWVFYTSNCGCCSSILQNCQGLQDHGERESGIYNITGVVSDGVFPVYCDMETDGGGWLVFQRRTDGSQDFYLGWDDYEKGFGDLSGEFWLGNRHLSKILSNGHFELRVDLEDWEGNKRYAKYDTFMIGNSCENYRLMVNGYSGNAGNSMTSNGWGFTTKDRDNDEYIYNCAELFEGAWWYSSCHSSNLNGLYLRGNHSTYANGVNWYAFKGFHYSLKSTEMKIRENFKV